MKSLRKLLNRKKNKKKKRGKRTNTKKKKSSKSSKKRARKTKTKKKTTKRNRSSRSKKSTAKTRSRKKRTSSSKTKKKTRSAKKSANRKKKSASRKTTKKKKTSQSKRKRMLSKLLIVGLGNPGTEYEKTRHNAGKDAVRLLAKRLGATLEADKKRHAQIGEVKQGKRTIFLTAPSTFMNTSGKAVKALLPKIRRNAKALVIVHDDMDLPLGTIKIVFGRGSGGHKGVESVIRAAGTKDFIRVRVGTMSEKKRTQKPGKRELEDIVVAPLTSGEQTTFRRGVRKAADALETLISEGREQAMNQFN